MTIVDIAKSAAPGERFKRAGSKREFHFTESKPPRLAVDYYGQTASFFSDDLSATDWEIVK